MNDSTNILAEVTGDTLEIIVEFEREDAQVVGLNLARSADHAKTATVSYDGKQLEVAGVKAPVAVRDGQKTLRLHIFLDKSVIEVFASWSLVRLLGSIPITPGGIGIVEVGLTTALVGFGGDNAEVVAAVLVYRFLTLVPTLVLGLAAGATWRRHRPKTEAATV